MPTGPRVLALRAPAPPDRCDAGTCRTQAVARAVFARTGHDLLFCGAHLARWQTALRASGATLVVNRRAYVRQARAGFDGAEALAILGDPGAELLSRESRALRWVAGLVAVVIAGYLAVFTLGYLRPGDPPDLAPVPVATSPTRAEAGTSAGSAPASVPVAPDAGVPAPRAR